VSREWQKHCLPWAKQMRDESFLQAIVERPDDDSIRLVYADWLEEHDQPERAEFIRVQIERVRLPDDDPKQAALFARELRLLARHGVEWRAGPPIFASARFRRGFIEYVEAPAGDMIEQAEELFRVAPVREICLTGMAENGQGAALASRPELARVESIRLNDMLGGPHEPAETATLLQSPNVRNIRALTVVSNFSCGLLRQLLARTAFSRLRSLHLNMFSRAGNVDRGADDAESEFEQLLVARDPADNSDRGADDVAGVLAEFPQLPLESLWVHKGRDCENSLSMGGLQRLVDSGHWRRLRELDVGVSPSNHQWPRFGELLDHSNLRVLRLREGEGTGVGALSFLSITDAKSWGSLEALGAHDIFLGGDEMEQLLANPNLGQLRRLALVNCGLESEDADAIITCPSLAGLRRLNLGANCRSDALATPKAAPMAGLVELDVSVTGRAAPAIGQSPYLRNVRILKVRADGAECPRAIAASPHLQSLTWLQMHSEEDDRVETAITQTLARNPALVNLSCVDWPDLLWGRDLLTPLFGMPWLRVDGQHIYDLETRAEYFKHVERTGGVLPPLDEFREWEWGPN